MDTTIVIPKKQIYIVPDLLILNQIEERLDVKPKRLRVTWTDQNNTERCITKLTDAHTANLANWLREHNLLQTEKIIQAELERRCTGAYPSNFESMVEEYSIRPETWRLKIY